MSKPVLLRRIAIVAIAAPLAALILVGAQLAGPNLTVVDPGRLYRSGQLSGPALRGVIQGRGIRTVINLRGRDDDARWYREEAAVVRETGAELVDVRLSSRRLPHRVELLKLLDAFRHAERPILVHCYSGGDRGGLAAAVYQVDHMDRTREEALDLLTWRHLHLGMQAPAMRAFVALYEGEEWARESYDPCTADYALFPKERLCARLRVAASGTPEDALP